jgi:hypothetical protein
MQESQGKGENGQGEGKSGSQASGSKGSGSQTSESQGSGSKGSGSQAGERGAGGKNGQAGTGASEKGGQTDSSSSTGSESGKSSSSGSGPNGQGKQPGSQNSGGSAGSEQGGKSGGGNQPGGRRGGDGQSNFGGGAANDGGPIPPKSVKDETKESPRATESQDQGADSLAPDGQPQSNLNLRTLNEALQDDARAKQLEKDTGLSREQLEQFSKRYEKVKSAPAGPGRNIDLKGGEQTDAKPSANLSGLESSTRFNTANRRGRGTAPQDQVRDNLEGARFQPPPEFRGKYEGFKNKLAKVVVPKGTPKPPATKSGQ